MSVFLFRKMLEKNKAEQSPPDKGSGNVEKSI